MNLKLNIYNGRKIEKTYTANEFDIELGTLEDLINLVDGKVIFDFDKKDKEWLSDVLKTVTGAIGTVRHLLKEIFDGVTDEELKHIKVKEVLKTVILPALSLSEYGLESSDSKN